MQVTEKCCNASEKCATKQQRNCDSETLRERRKVVSCLHYHEIDRESCHCIIVVEWEWQSHVIFVVEWEWQGIMPCHCNYKTRVTESHAMSLLMHHNGNMVTCHVFVDLCQNTRKWRSLVPCLCCYVARATRTRANLLLYVMSVTEPTVMSHTAELSLPHAPGHLCGRAAAQSQSYQATSS